MVVNSRIGLPILLSLAGCLLVSLCLPQAVVPRRVLWRSRIILIGIVVVYSWTSPGVLMWPDVGLLSPTHEGCLAGGMQVLRILVALVSLGWAMNGLTREQRLTGFVALLHPLHRLGVPVERGAVRLALTLSWMDALPAHMRWAEWRQAWTEALASEGVREDVRIELGAFSWLDRSLHVLALIGIALCVGL